MRPWIAFVTVAILLLMGWLVRLQEEAAARPPRVAPPRDAEPALPAPPRVEKLVTIEHDGHRFILNTVHGGYFIHHPDCKCLHKGERRELHAPGEDQGPPIPPPRDRLGPQIPIGPPPGEKP